jgi:hypothetical protein
MPPNRHWPWTGLTSKIKNAVTPEAKMDPEAKIDHEIRKYEKHVSHSLGRDEVGASIDSLRRFSAIQNEMEKGYEQGKLSREFVSSRSATMSELAITDRGTLGTSFGGLYNRANELHTRSQGEA